MTATSTYHVTHVIPTLGVGGAERFVVSLLKHKPVGEQASLILMKEHAPLQDQLPSDVTVYMIPKSKYSIGYKNKLSEVLDQISPDIVHTHLFGADVWGAAAAAQLGVPVISTEHGLNTDEGILKTLLKRRAYHQYTNTVVSPAAALTKMLEKRYRVPREQIVSIAHGINVTQFACDPLHITRDSHLNILMYGRLSKEKGFDIGLRAIARLPKNIYKLTIVGEGREYKSLHKLVQQLDIEEQVTLIPFTNDVPGLLRQHDVVLFPSRSEGLGIAIMESLAAGRIVIASNVGGIPDIITDGKNGWLVPSQDVEAFAKKLLAVQSHVVEASAVAKTAAKEAGVQFDISTMRNAYTSLYQSRI